MKKARFAIALAMMILLGQTAQSQTDKLDLQFTAGGGISTIRNDRNPDLGFATHLMLFYRFSHTFSAGIGGGFEQIGSRENNIYYNTFSEPLYSYNTRVTSDYVSIPLLLRAETGQKLKFFANTGVTAGLFLNETYHFSDQIQDAYCLPMSNGDCDLLNVAATMGAGIMIPLKEKSYFILEARENYGLTTVSEFYGLNPKTQSFHLLAGMRLTL